MQARLLVRFFVLKQTGNPWALVVAAARSEEISHSIGQPLTPQTNSYYAGLNCPQTRSET